MEISELGKLNRDLEDMIMARKKLDEIRKGLSIAKRMTARWIDFRVSRLIGEIDRRIGQKKAEIAREEAGNGHGQERREENADRADPLDADFYGRAETDVREERERAGAAGGAAGQLGNVEPVRHLAAGEGAGGREHATAGGGTAEDCLRRRSRARNGLRDWQKVIMDADRAGRHERLVL